jgi:hypothetical protein
MSERQQVERMRASLGASIDQVRAQLCDELAFDVDWVYEVVRAVDRDGVEAIRRLPDHRLAVLVRLAALATTESVVRRAGRILDDMEVS